MIHPNSITAYWQGRVEHFGKRTQAVISCLKSSRGPMSDREVMIALGFTDMNAVRPRLTELVESGIAEEVGNQRDPVTGKTVRLVRLARREAQAEFDLGIAVEAARSMKVG